MNDGIKHIIRRANEAVVPEIWSLYKDSRKGYEDFEEALGKLISITIEELRPVKDSPYVRWFRTLPIDDDHSAVCIVEIIQGDMIVRLGHGADEEEDYIIERWWYLESLDKAEIH